MNIFNGLQRLGKALMLPIAVLPVAGLLLRLGAPDVFDIPVMTKAGGAIFDNLAPLFAVGIALGFAKDNAGAAGLAALVGYFVLNTGATTINDTINMGVLAGIITGVVAGLLYNRFYTIKLPDYLGFFGGRRFVPIVTGGVCLLLAVLFGLVWPPIQTGINAIGNWIVTSGVIGAFFYGTLNRLLIPLGLHHVLNSLVWFIFGSFTDADGSVITGDLNRYFAGDPTAGTFMAGFYPMMMFGLPAACLAMVHMARPEKARVTAGVMLSMALTSFLTGITEPVEFTFMFLAPVLYGIHAVLTGLSLALMDILGVKHGFTFSAGAIDYILNYGLSTRGWLILPFGLIYAGVYYFLFRFCIQALDLKTPGREDDDIAQLAAAANAPTHAAPAGAPSSDGREPATLARQYVEALGGFGNLKTIDSCITRLRLVMNDRSIVHDESLKALGAKGVMRPGTDTLQVIIGPQVDAIAEEMRNLRDTSSGGTPQAPPTATPNRPTDAPVAPTVMPASSATVSSSAATTSELATAEQVQHAIAALGGPANIGSVEAVALTRLRLRINDVATINEEVLQTAGVQGIMRLPDHKLHLLVGLKADQYAAEMKEQLAKAK